MGSMQVPVKEREKLLKKEGLDPTRLANLTLVYKVQEVALPGMTSADHLNKTTRYTCSRLLQVCSAIQCRQKMLLRECHGQSSSLL